MKKTPKIAAQSARVPRLQKGTSRQLKSTLERKIEKNQKQSKLEEKKPKALKLSTNLKAILSSKVDTSKTVSHSKWIPIDRPLILPGYVKEALEKLDEAGHLAFIVGGSVRDAILGRAVKDHDIATSALPDELCRIFPHAVTVGKKFGVLKLPVAHGAMLEISTFRKDLEYEDHRHPKGVLFAGPEEDAKRRDFTINALFFDPKTSRILDCENGLVDLSQKIIRAIGNPHERFREDALRLLRAVRFSAALDFEIETETKKAMIERARLVSKVSYERIRDELSLMICGPNAKRAIEMLSDFGLLKYVLPEVDSLKTVSQGFEHTLKVLDCVVRQNPGCPAELAWAALFHDIGRPQLEGKQKTQKGVTEKLSASLGRVVGVRLRLSHQEVELISSIIESQSGFRDVFQMREATLQRMIRRPDFGILLSFHRADAAASDGNLVYYEFWASRWTEWQKSAQNTQKLLTGEDLVQLGLNPGPKFAEILRTVEDLQLEEKIRTKSDALEFVLKHFVR